MAKILLVEDDNNLREIYEARLQAEGYTIVSAMNGEEALVVAKKEKPDLVISDVMMPQISGFEMLDILRNTEDLKHVKVIMLTALGQAEDKTRADSLGADRYLVKSQVTLEDIVKAAQELLGPEEPSAPQATAAAAEQNAAMASASAGQAAPAASSSVAAVPVQAAPTAAPVAAPAPAPEPVAAPSIPVVAPPVPTPVATTQVSAASDAAAPAPTVPAPTPADPNPAPAVSAMPTAPTSAPTLEPAIPTPAPAATTVPNEPDEQPGTGVPTPTTPPQPPTVTPPAPAPPVAPPTAQDEPAAPEVSPAPTPSAPATDTAALPTPAVPAEPEGTNEAGTAPEISPAPAEPSTPAAQSASDEEATMKAQIESFVSQNSQTAPKPAGEVVMADAIKNLVSETEHPSAKTAEPKIITPANPSSPPTPPVKTEKAPPAPENDSVSVAHKKIISPISDPTAVQPVGLDELLAKEGITNMDDEGHPLAPGASPTTNPALPTQPTTPTLPSTPHPPGHVISPNNAGVDPNTIAL